MLKADFHMHSCYSPDSSVTLEQLVQRCQETGLNCIALSDHGTAEGALKLQSMAPFKVIVAEEILTPHGEIMGMFLRETIPTNIPVPEAIARIKEQGGLVNVPHPFDVFRQSALDPAVLEEIAGQIDLVEVFNARSLLPITGTRAAEFARRYNLPQSVGSDAHTVAELGKCYIEIPEFQGKGDFLQALRQGKINGHRANPFVHFNTVLTKMKAKL